MSLDWVIETYQDVQSTQDIVRGMADTGQPEGCVVHALSQSQGRGRHGRIWQSFEGNLFLSLLLRPSCQAREIGQLSLIAGIAVLEAIEATMQGGLNGALSLKWPNDVLLDGKKCAGLLLETELSQDGNVEWAVLGIGMNVDQAPEELGVAINAYAGECVTAVALRDQFLRIIDKHYEHWLGHGFDELREQWIGYAHAQGQPMHVKIGAHLENGIFHDIDAFGNLRLRDMEQRLKTVSSGEVYLY